MKAQADKEDTKCRLDKWLWAARFFKTRSLATAAIETGKVHVDGDRVKPAKEVHVGQLVHIRNKDFEAEVTVNALSNIRRVHQKPSFYIARPKQVLQKEKTLK